MTRSDAQAHDNKDSSCPRESLIILIHDQEGSCWTLHDRPGGPFGPVAERVGRLRTVQQRVLEQDAHSSVSFQSVFIERIADSPTMNHRTPGRAP